MARAARRLIWIGLAAFVVAETAAVAALGLRAWWQRRAEGTPVVRGWKIAERAGCFACHGPGGARPIPNPGSRDGEVPSWTGGTWMMWNKTEEDVRAWITDGHPPDRDPDRAALIRMPAYKDRLSALEIDDLTAYVLAVSQFGWPEDEAVARGRDVAVRFGCFGCHGPEGRGLVSNPGGYKSYVAPWDGADYADLVRDDEEFRQWVKNGISDRFEANPAARFFLDRAPIKMPAYGDRIAAGEVEALLAYVRWVRDHPRGSKTPS